MKNKLSLWGSINQGQQEEAAEEAEIWQLKRLLHFQQLKAHQEEEQLLQELQEAHSLCQELSPLHCREKKEKALGEKQKKFY